MARIPVDAPYDIRTGFGDPDPNALFGLHSGIDYAKPVGSPVYAPESGKVVYAQLHPVRGNMVIIFTGRFYHRLMHNSRFNVQVGYKVTEGDIVAYSGGALGALGSGLSTGAHVHHDINTEGIEVTKFSNFVDPARWLLESNKEKSMDTITKEQEMVLAQMVTGSNPGKDYNYPFVGKELNAKNLDAMLNTWLGRKQTPVGATLSPEQQNAITALKTFKDALNALWEIP